MRRREFVGVVAAAAPWVHAQRAEFDLVVRGGELYDGTGGPPRRADVAISGGRIAAVAGRVDRGAEEIDARGLAVAPGFIDIHSHADLSLLINPRAESRVRQGVTLEVAGQDGSSIGPWSDGEFERIRDQYRRDGVEIDFKDVGGFLDRIDRLRPAVNVASMVGHGTVRRYVIGNAAREATEEEEALMARLVRNALERGAVGLSSGLEYTPGSFAATSELVRLASELRGTPYPFASHMRNEDDRVLSSLEEVLDIGRAAGCPVQVSHLKAQGERNYWKAQVALEMIEAANARGPRVRHDRYPYVAYATGLSNLFPAAARAGGGARLVERLSDPGEAAKWERACRDKVALLGDWNAVQVTRAAGSVSFAAGRKMGELAEERGVDPYRLVVEILDATGGSAGMIGFGMSEENTEKILAHPLGMVCSDGGAFAPYGPLSRSTPHPRGYGSFPRVLGYYVRERGAMSLETAVYKMSGYPAETLGLSDRGAIALGKAGDVVVFDPDRVRDRADFERPHQYPEGIPHVIVGGARVISDGDQTGSLGGRAVRGIGRSRATGR